jgi:hypothetical protein
MQTGQQFKVRARCVLGLKPQILTFGGNRHWLSSTSSFRWAGRSSSQQLRRFDWKPPIALPTTDNLDILERYSSSNNMLEAPAGPVSEMAGDNPTTIIAPTSSLHELRVGVSPVELPTTEITADRYFVAWADCEGQYGTSLKVTKGDIVKALRITPDGTSSLIVDQFDIINLRRMVTCTITTRCNDRMGALLASCSCWTKRIHRFQSQ